MAWGKKVKSLYWLINVGDFMKKNVLGVIKSDMDEVNYRLNNHQDDYMRVFSTERTRKHFDEIFFSSNFFLVSITMQTRFGSSRECDIFTTLNAMRYLSDIFHRLKEEFIKFSRPLCDAKYVYDFMKNIKKRCSKNIFHRNFVPKFHNYLKF